MLFVVVLSCALAATTTTTTAVLFCVQCNRKSSMPHVPLLLPPRVEFNCRCLVLLLVLLLIRIISCLLGCLPDSVLYLPRNVARSQFLTASQRRLRCRTQCQSLGSPCCKQRESINRRTASMDRRLSKYFWMLPQAHYKFQLNLPQYAHIFHNMPHANCGEGETVLCGKVFQSL